MTLQPIHDPGWPLQVLISSMSSFAAIVVLLMLFWLVFSIVGLHVYGGITIEPPGWPNCDTLINSLILNFHVRWQGRAGLLGSWV